MAGKHSWHRQARGCAALAGTLVLLGCTSTSVSSSQGEGRSSSLVVGVTGDTSSLNPQNCAPIIYCLPVYSALVGQNADGAFVPDLATNWKFTDAKHTTLQLTLRKNAYFTDGSALTASSVVASLNVFRNTPGPGQANAKPVDGITAVGVGTVDIHYSTPVTRAFAEWQLTVQNGFGAIIGPKGLANAKSLDTTSDGIGPYKLDAQQTTQGVQYAYVPNGRYFNQDAIKYNEVILKPMQNTSSRLSAIESGQIDWAQGISQGNVSAAEAAGLHVSEGKLGASPAGSPMLVLAQRTSGPLADVRVRQAISYAVPRSEITKAVYGTSATPTSSMVPQGAEGYNAADTNLYAYNSSKAKQLLAQAGYPNGLTLEVYDPSFFDTGNELGQALESALANVGIRVKLVTSDAPPGTVVQQVEEGKYAAYIWDAGATGLSSLAYVNFESGAYMNPFKVPSDAQLDQLLQKAALSATAEGQEQGMQAATARLDELEWAVPIATVPTFQATQKNVTNVPQQFYTRDLNPFSSVTSRNWYS